MNNPTDNKIYDTLNQYISAARHLNQFTTIVLNQALNRFIAQKVNRFPANHYDHTVTRYIEDSPNNDDPNINPNINN